MGLAVGKIKRVSGPLVVAEGMKGSMVYEVVYVGREKLIGEVIGLQGDNAFIQVYEDTSGLEVGEPVEGSGSLLSAELGPGIVGKVYDGLQRPLSVIGSLIGPFVKRGIKLPALPRDVKWFFRRNQSIKVGDKVGPGDFLGVVKETPLIDHKIMVPPNVHGTLKEIASDGDYTVGDVIGVVESGGSTTELTMLQKWPVRKPRPYVRRLEPTEPLITGQRVLDLMFPIAKGGKAAVPGGFGSGKCVPPGTPVLLASWRLKPIDELFRVCEGRRLRLSDKEVLVELKEPLHVIGFDGRKFRVVRATHIYKGYTDYIVKIRTALGRVLEITPNHELPVLSSRALIRYEKAINIKPGALLVVPSYIPLATHSNRPLVMVLSSLKGVTSRDVELNAKVREVLKNLSKRELEWLSRASGLSIKTLNRVKRRNANISLKLIVALREELGLDVGLPSMLGLRGSRTSIRVPQYVNEDIAEILGLIASNGMLRGGKVVFFSSSPSVKERFRELMLRAFGVDGKLFTMRVEISSALITRILKALGVSGDYRQRDVSVPEVVMRSTKEVALAFVRGLLLGGGSFYQGKAVYSSSSLKLVRDLTYLLTKLGIAFSVKVDKVRGRYRVIIPRFDREALNGVEALNPSIPPPQERGQRVEAALQHSVEGAAPYEALKSGVVYRGLIKEGINPYSLSYGKVGNVLAQTTARINRSSKLKEGLKVFSYVALDKVEEVEVVRKEGEVYDLVVEETHNFVGGFTPTIYHNTVLLQTLTKWARTKLNIYVGCGERGNEMADALHSFLRLKDPASGRPLAEKAVFIANTSNMPVAARETSVFLGVTIGEYFRDMGYDVLMVADSTSRWAEAMREISARLEEMPGEEGFPAYLGSRLAEFYERSGRVECLGGVKRVGSLTIIGAVSPPGADFSEPVTQNTLRYIGTLIALDIALANRRHFPAVSWLLSYSLYVDGVERWWRKSFREWRALRDRALNVLQREAELMEIVRLVGPDALPESDKLLLDVARMVREDFLQQNAYHPIDSYCPPDKTVLMLSAIMRFYEEASKALASGVPLEKIRSLPVRAKIARMKEVPYEKFREAFKALINEIELSMKSLTTGGEG